MLDPQLVFGLAGELMLPLWLVLGASVFVRRLQPIVDGIAFIGLPLLLGATYVVVLLPHVPFSQGGFGSLGQLRELFAADGPLLAGWLHFLVFDFFVGGWISQNSRTAGVSRGVVLVALVLSFVAGPAGLLVYLLARFISRPTRTAVQG